ncbi:hypothetical protein PIB30_079586 [Stylosanthes scabra]|uniref:Uncharacterized protein n=1 Tax=Stylosanthes scabra TaxID=79078 RepID=A0ABU6UUW4_9FABA|nr:hypothetical protein [Stylosanthes scabra]
MGEDDFKLYCNKLVSEALVLEMKYGLRPADQAAGNRVASKEGIKDPVWVRTKGTGRSNHAAGTSDPKKRHKCSNCRRLGHRRTHCHEATNRGTQDMPMHGSTAPRHNTSHIGSQVTARSVPA